MLSIGQLDRRIEIYAPVYTIDDYGEETKVYEDITYSLWAHADWKNSKRKEESQEQVQGTDLVFYVRNLGVTILGTYRIVYDSKTYIIHGIKEIDGREKFLEIETKLKDNN
jgi:head-tail adaptor